jgi:hypothetical protein
MGHWPGVVRLPTIQVQEIFPAPSEVFATKPWAWDGPDLYSTWMEQPVFGDVFTMRVVAWPCRADSGAFTKLTLAAWTGG